MKYAIRNNPIRWLTYAVIVWLFIGVFNLLSAIIKGDIWHISCSKEFFNAIDPLMPFCIVFSLLFLYLYHKKSLYAWHTMMIPLVLDLPSYLILRRYNIYYQPLDVLNDIYLFVIWMVFIIAMLLILPRYKKYLAELSSENLSKDELNDHTTAKRKLWSAGWCFLVAVVMFGIGFLLARLPTNETKDVLFRVVFLILLVASIAGLWKLFFAILIYFSKLLCKK